jgi:hypothetical protein
LKINRGAERELSLVDLHFSSDKNLIIIKNTAVRFSICLLSSALTEYCLYG